MTIKLGMLRVFREVAEKGSLAAAADALGRTPSAVSMMLAQLEADIGAPLFETERKSRLTALGRIVLEESARATDAFGRSVDAIRRNAASLAGTVRIAAVPSATITLLPEVIVAFRRARPEVRLEISDVDSKTVERRILLDEADIGILSTATNESGRGEPILEDDLGLVCRADSVTSRHADSDGESWDLIDLEPLIANPLVLLVDHPKVRDVLKDCNMEARNTLTLLSFVRAGLGTTVLPRGALINTSGTLRFIAPGDPPVRRQLRKIRRMSSSMSPAAVAFWSAL